MSKLTAAQVAGYAKAAGWTGQDLAVAVAVALAESGGRTDARGDVALQTGTWGPSIGLWQIRSIKADKGTGRLRDEAANLNPSTNARHAHQLWADQGWSPWTTYTGGRYLAHLPAARAAAAAPAAATGTTTVGVVPFVPDPGDVYDALQAATSIVDVARVALTYPVKTLAWISDRNNWQRVGLVTAGMSMVVGGVLVVAIVAAGKGANYVMGGASRIGKVSKTAARVGKLAGGN